MNRGNEPAFPIGTAGYPGAGDGLTIREQFAMAALQGILANESESAVYAPSTAAASAVDYADALLAALAAEQPAAAPAQPIFEKLEAALHSLYDYGCEERLPSSNSLAFAKEALEEAGAAP